LRKVIDADCGKDSLYDRFTSKLAATPNEPENGECADTSESGPSGKRELPIAASHPFWELKDWQAPSVDIDRKGGNAHVAPPSCRGNVIRLQPLGDFSGRRNGHS